MPGPIPDGTRAVFFDAVGTLLFPDPPAAAVYAEVAGRAGVALPPAEVKSRFLAAYRAEEETDRLARWVTSESREVARWQRIVTDTLRDVPNPTACFRELFNHFSRPTAWRVDPDAARMLTHLRDRGSTLGMGSNYDSRLLTVLDGFPELAPLRDRIVVSTAVGFRKPSREFFREVVRVANCDADEVLFVGDDLENDCEGATAAGLRAVLLDPRERYGGMMKRITRLVELIEHRP